jgi:rhodanese-related sulfurtransferase
LDQLKSYKLIYIHCRSGARATAAAQTLTNAGFNNIVCITGSGMADWIACGLPVERNT